MLNDDAKKARSEYNKLLKSLDAQARQALKEHLDLIGQMIDEGLLMKDGSLIRFPDPDNRT
mgnify:CR=1 FL=1